MKISGGRVQAAVRPMKNPGEWNLMHETPRFATMKLTEAVWNGLSTCSYATTSLAVQRRTRKSQCWKVHTENWWHTRQSWTAKLYCLGWQYLDAASNSWQQCSALVTMQGWWQLLCTFRIHEKTTAQMSAKKQQIEPYHIISYHIYSWIHMCIYIYIHIPHCISHDICT